MKQGLFYPVVLGLSMVSTSQAAVILVPALSDGNLALSGAGGAAIADNATIAYTNPAGMTVLGKDSLSGSVGVMVYDSDYSSFSGESAPNSGSTMGYGNFFIVKQLPNDMALGFTLTAPG
ncbi:outer membrane protein transport protein, partial [Vibrio mediterranei]|uniref:outer membrane protein transport protein n=1 Tax=Vibrio mediterranei TaxID=689 RepID=UPI00148CC484